MSCQQFNAVMDMLVAMQELLSKEFGVMDMLAAMQELLSTEFGVITGGSIGHVRVCEMRSIAPSDSPFESSAAAPSIGDSFEGASELRQAFGLVERGGKL